MVPGSAALRLLLGLAAALAVAVALAWLLQRRLLYFPARQDLEAATRLARARGLEPWAPPPGGALLGWRTRTAGAGATLLVFHGNAGTALDRAYVAAAFARASPALPLDVVLVEYPGYGPRPGAPSQETILGAAREAIRAARAEGPVFLAGESLGSAVAALAAAEARDEVAGVMLVTPLASVPAVGRRHYPLVPAAFFRDPWRADLALPRYGGPVAFLVAGADEVTFADLGEALHAAYPGPKRLWVEPGAGHNTLDWSARHPRWGEIVEFLRDPGS